MNLKKEDKVYQWLLLLAMLLWGGGWTALKILTVSLPMDVIIFWRFFIMSLSFLPIIYFFKEPIRIDKKSLLFVISSAVLNIAFMVSSFLGIASGLAGAGSVIITSLSPILTFLLMIILFRKRVATLQYIGLFLGVVGGFVILQLENFMLFLHSSNSYFLLSATIWAGVTILSQKAHAHIHAIHYSFFISVIATVASFIYAIESDLSAVFEQGVVFWSALIYLAVLGQTVATTIFFMASGKLGSEKTSSFMFLVPVFSLLSAWVVLGEPILMHVVIGGIVSMLAVLFINRQPASP